MALLLHIETSGPICSVAISKNGKIISELQNDETNAHAQVLTLLIHELLLDSQIAFTDLQAVSISSGPGSYTGLRIGSSTAKGICYAMDIPLIALSTLHIMKSYSQSPDILVLIDARRMDAYAAFFASNQLIFEKNCTLNEDFFNQLKNQYPNFETIGNLGDKLNSLENFAEINYSNQPIPTARFQSNLAYQKWKNKEFEPIDLFTPNYLKTWEEGQTQLKNK